MYNEALFERRIAVARANKTRYALLGMLANGPASGYDIKKAMQQTTNHFWAEGDGAIYPILKQLLAEDLVTLSIENADTGKPKKVYAVTEDGLASLHDWLVLEPEPMVARHELMLKVFFGWQVAPSVTIRHLTIFRDSLESRLQNYYALRQKKQTQHQDQKNIHQTISLNAGIKILEANLNWCRESIATLRELE